MNRVSPYLMGVKYRKWGSARGKHRYPSPAFLSGGVGKVTNTIVGALVIMSLTNGMNLLGVDIAFQYIVKGAIFIFAVAFDVVSRRK